MSYLPDFDTAADEIELLATLLRNSEWAAEIVDLIDPAEIAEANVSELWASARQLCAAGKSVDDQALLRELAGHPRRGVVERVLGKAASGVGEPHLLRERVSRIRETRARERIAAAGARLQQVAGQAHVDLDQVRERALAEILGTEDHQAGGPVHIGEAMGQFLEAQRSVTADRVIRTPWANLNTILGGGLHRQRVYVVGGVTGGGKSVIGLALAAHAAERGLATLVFSAEMSTVEVTGRWFSRTSRVPLDHIVSYTLGPGEKQAAEALQGTTDPLFILDRPNISAPGLHSVTHRFQRQHDVRLVVVDYLQLLEATDLKAQRYQQVGAMARQLHLTARELDVAVVVLAQLNRASASRADQRPRKDDLRESGEIEQNASAVILAHLVDQQQGESSVPTGELELIVAKNRHGRQESVMLTQDFAYADLRG